MPLVAGLARELQPKIEKREKQKVGDAWFVIFKPKSNAVLNIQCPIRNAFLNIQKLIMYINNRIMLHKTNWLFFYG